MKNETTRDNNRYFLIDNKVCSLKSYYQKLLSKDYRILTQYNLPYRSDPMSNSKIFLTLTVPEDIGEERLDSTLAKLMPEYSRTTIQNWIKNRQITVNGKVVKRKYRLTGNEYLSVQFTPDQPLSIDPEPIDLNIHWSDEHLIIINKPSGLIVHPGAGNLQGTMMNGLLHLYPELAYLPRAGIVHRLDKNTTGLLVVARTEEARKSLVSQLAKSTMKRIYQAVCEGVLIAGMTINKPISRHPKDRLRMTISNEGKSAISHVRVNQKFRSHTLIEVALETGRTHQIRVHLNSIGHPLVGDNRYGCRTILPKAADGELIQYLRGFQRQALHAGELSLIHPKTNKDQSWQVNPPEDFQKLVDLLTADIQSQNSKRETFSM